MTIRDLAPILHVQDVLDEIEYRPDHRFSMVRDAHPMDPHLIMERPVIDVDKGTPGVFMQSHALSNRDATGPEEFFLAEVVRMVEQAELHEAHEWLRYKGVPIIGTHGRKGYLR